MKRLIIAILIVMGVSNVAFAANDDVHVNWDGKEMQFDVKPQIIKGHVMLPMRALFEQDGYFVGTGYSSDGTNLYGCSRIDDPMSFDMRQKQIGSSIYQLMYWDSRTSSGQDMDTEMPLINKDGRLLISIRDFANANPNVTVSWDSNTRTVFIKHKPNTFDFQKILEAARGNTINSYPYFKSDIPVTQNVQQSLDSAYARLSNREKDTLVKYKTKIILTNDEGIKQYQYPSEGLTYSRTPERTAVSFSQIIIKNANMDVVYGGGSCTQLEYFTRELFLWVTGSPTDVDGKVWPEVKMTLGE